MIGKYSIQVKCSNCGYSGTVEILKGVRVEDERCPICGCRTLHKSGFTFPDYPIKPVPYPYHPYPTEPYLTPSYPRPHLEEGQRYWCEER